MIDPIWPEELPPCQRIGASGGPQNNVVSFEPEVGPSIDRRRASSKVRRYQFELPVVSPEQRDIFVNFFEADLVDGVLPFEWYDPFTRTTARWKFVHNSPPYTEEGITPDLFVIKFELMLLASDVGS